MSDYNFFLYDNSKRDSFNELRYWVNQYRNIKNSISKYNAQGKNQFLINYCQNDKK